jgi:hypothetical protein
MMVSQEHKYDVGKVTFETFCICVLDIDLKVKLVAVS